MRYLFLMRGLPGSGKSTWIKENKLEEYTISTDTLRAMFASPAMKLDGDMALLNKQDRYVFQFLNILLEEKMSRGEMIFVDATHYRAKFISDYKKLAKKYRYRVYVVDFTDVNIDICLKNNKDRTVSKYVPEMTIRKMAEVIKQNKDDLPTFALNITRQECLDMVNSIKPLDFTNKWNRIVVFGDIHGCYQPLEQYFSEHPFAEDSYYIFTGDYIDRGLQNKEVMEFLFKIKDKKNVLMLEGNHERWLRLYANNNEESIDSEDIKTINKHLPLFKEYWELNTIRSYEFNKRTAPQLDMLNKKEIARFCSRLGQMAYFTYYDKKYVVSHGGITSVPNIAIPTEQYIKGVGEYGDTFDMYKTLTQYEDTVFIHAHRNLLKHDVKASDNSYNLCDEVEWGGYLRVLHITLDGIETFKYKNSIFREPPADTQTTKTEMTVKALKESPLTRVIDFGKISSINFTRNAFEKKQWDELSCTARGLYVENDTDKVVARSYNKFFNLGERQETKILALRKNLKFPVDVFLKENGFLGIVSVYDGDFLFASKAHIDSDYAEYVKELFYKLYNQEQRKAMFAMMSKTDSTMVFECIHHKDNSHPIIYTEDKMILLDVIKNNLEYSNLPYEKLLAFAVKHNITCKKKCAKINSLEEFIEFIEANDYKVGENPYLAFEGFVFVDSSGFMFKKKTSFYCFWKWQRTLLERMQKFLPVKQSFDTVEEIKVFNILDDLKNKRLLNKKMVIQDIEKIFYEEMQK